MVPITQIEFRKGWWQVLAHLNLAHMGPPHSLRHSRPSHEMLNDTMTLENLRRRGRWQSLKSVQRYTKSHVLIAKKGLLSAQQRQQGQAFWDGMPDALVGMPVFAAAHGRLLQQAARWVVALEPGPAKVPVSLPVAPPQRFFIYD